MDCWKCGGQIQAGSVYHRDVPAGHTTTVGMQGGWIRSNHFQRVPLCVECASGFDAWQKQQQVAAAIVLLVFILLPCLGLVLWLTYGRG
jgi:hypothetical protein